MSTRSTPNGVAALAAPTSTSSFSPTTLFATPEDASGASAALGPELDIDAIMRQLAAPDGDFDNAGDGGGEMSHDELMRLLGSMEDGALVGHGP